MSQPKNRARLERANKHEDRVRLHTRVETGNQTHRTTVPGGFFDFVRNLITAPGKFERFIQLFRVPTPTVTLTDEIFSSLDKVFDGRDPVVERTFSNESFESDYADYWNEELGGDKKWRQFASQAMKTKFNHIVVIDLPAEQSTPRPAPYYYELSPAQIIDFDDDDGDFLWLLFWANSDRTEVAYYDAEGYFVYQVNQKSGGVKVEGLISESLHDLGYCPVTSFWHDRLNGDTFERLGPVSLQLGELDHLLKDTIFARHHRLYAANPVWSGFKIDCGFSDTANDTYCDNGALREMTTDDYIVNPRTSALVPCPRCSKARDFAGPGTYVEVDPPSNENGEVDLRNPVQVLEPGVALLDFNVKDVERQERKIYQAVVGNSQEVIDNQAINRDQVQSLFESGTTSLIKLKPNLERTQNFIEETIAALRYSPEAIVNFSTDYGTQFFLVTAESVLDIYNDAKEKNADHSVLDALQDQYFETKFRHNDEMLMRMRLLSSIDPCRHLTTEQARLLFNDKVISIDEYAVKANLSSLIMRFERENTKITDFGELTDYGVRVANIRASLIRYAQENRPEPEPPPPIVQISTPPGQPAPPDN